MGKCRDCGKEYNAISQFLGLCRNCILHDFKSVEPLIQEAHLTSREAYGLPPSPPKDEGGISCGYCFNRCRMGKGESGYCGVRIQGEGGKIGPPPKQGIFSWYYDPLPTNCVASWICPGGTGAGFPKYAYSRTAEYGYKNLAVFYYGCTFNCLFCQNWVFREGLRERRPQPSLELSQAVDRWTSCICYFGGDPSPQLPHSIHASRLALAQKQNRILRVCWETNGSMNSRFLEETLEIALESGGCVKFDLKTFNSNLNVALCGRPNEQTKANFELAAGWTKKRKDPPLVMASTLLVPGYIEREEVYQIAKFIAALDREIPYSLLGFYPHFYFEDLPCTSRRHAQECRQAALEAGLSRVNIGNIHLLGKEY